MDGSRCNQAPARCCAAAEPVVCVVNLMPGVLAVSHTRCPAWQPVPLPPPGWAWQWEYAGYRNKDGTITSEPKAKGNGRFRVHDMPCPDADWKG